jgi:thioredoxin-related protein
MKLAGMSRALELFSRLALIGAMFIALTAASARAAELVMFEQAGCTWCEAFDRDIGSIYNKTEDGLRAPLRRVDIAQPLPADLAFLQVERLTPLFVLVDKGAEIGRIRGYGGRDMFWMQLYTLMQKLDAAGTAGERARKTEKSLHAKT